MSRSKRLVASLLLASSLITGCCKTKHNDAHRSMDINSANAAKATFLKSWTKTDNQPFKIDALAASVSASPDFLSFDAISPNRTVIEGWDAYRGIWEPGMNGFKSAQLTEIKSLRTWQDQNTAITCSLVRIYGVLPDGNTLDTTGHLTLVFKREMSQWKVIHEHMSVGVKP